MSDHTQSDPVHSSKNDATLAPEAESADELRSPCSYLFHEFHRFPAKRRTRLHSHDYWHADYISDGHAECVAGGEVVKMTPNSVLLIPPKVHHGVIYIEPTQVLSIKFQAQVASGRSEVLLTNDPAVVCLLNAAECLLEPTRTMDLRAVGHVLAALLSAAYPDAVLRPLGAATTVAEQVHRVVARMAGYPVSVTTLGKRLGKSPAYLSQQFRRETGHSLKKWLDHRRCETAARLLRDTAASVTDIAGQCGYRDVYAFSRFFARIMGQSPTEYRKRQR